MSDRHIAEWPPGLSRYLALQEQKQQQERSRAASSAPWCDSTKGIKALYF